jgi:hypothetical protein
VLSWHRTLDEAGKVQRTVGKEEALQATSVGPGKLLRRAIEADRRFWREALKRRA